MCMSTTRHVCVLSTVQTLYVESVIKLNTYLVEQLNKYDLAYLHLVTARIAGERDILCKLNITLLSKFDGAEHLLSL